MEELVQRELGRLCAQPQTCCGVTWRAPASTPNSSSFAREFCGSAALRSPPWFCLWFDPSLLGKNLNPGCCQTPAGSRRRAREARMCRAHSGKQRRGALQGRCDWTTGQLPRGFKCTANMCRPGRQREAGSEPLWRGPIPS